MGWRRGGGIFGPGCARELDATRTHTGDAVGAPTLAGRILRAAEQDEHRFVRLVERLQFALQTVITVDFLKLDHDGSGNRRFASIIANSDL